MQIFQNKYAPQTLDDLILPNTNTRQRLEEFAQNLRHGSLIFHGPHGTAKTTTARMLERLRAGDAEYGGVDFYRASDLTVKSFERIENMQAVQRLAGVQMPITIIDEIDRVDEDVQYLLRWQLDMHSDKGCFIMTTNKLHRVYTGVVDSCDVIEMPTANNTVWLNRAHWILKQEGVTLSNSKLLQLLSTCDGSIRDLMRALEDVVVRERPRLRVV